MMAKIVQGRGFKGAISYVLDKHKAELLAWKGVRTIDKDSIIHSFITQSTLNPITKPVAHISLDFSAQDREKITNAKMLGIAQEYLKKMGYPDKSLLAIDRSDYVDDGFMLACIEEHYRVEFLSDRYMILSDLEDVEVEPDDYTIKMELEKI